MNGAAWRPLCFHPQAVGIEQCDRPRRATRSGVAERPEGRVEPLPLGPRPVLPTDTPGSGRLAALVRPYCATWPSTTFSSSEQSSHTR